jgi:amino acid adenylation domain-containing protein
MNDMTQAARLTAVDYDPFASDELARAVPTTEAQRELWLGDQLGREASLAYNESITLAFRGPLNAQALADALLALSDRHEALRSTISDDGLNMLIAPRGRLQASVIDLQPAGEDAQQEALARLRAEAVETPFDLVRGPLVRAVLARLAADRHELILTAHHIVCDGWSFGVIARDLCALYRGIASDRVEPPLIVADSFGDHALELLADANTKAAEDDLRYWVSTYDGSVPVLDLPTDRPRPPVRSFASRRVDLALEAPLVDAVRKLGNRCGTSLFVTMFGMFAGLMSRLAGTQDVVVGVPAAGQSAHGKDSLVGHCVNLLPIRVGVDLEQPVETLLAQARSRVLDAYEHQGATFGTVLGKLQLERDPSRLPLVSVQFNLDAAVRSQDISPDGLEVALRSNPRHFENFELFVNASQIDGRIVLECQYNQDLFDPATVLRWLELYRAALERAARDPAGAAVQSFLPTQADAALLARFNDTAADYPRDTVFSRLFEATATRAPQRTAVRCAGQALSYDELNEQANRIARRLRALGVGHDAPVGVCLPRSLDLMVALLGVQKAGAAYVPLDPDFPVERLSFMLQDSGARVLVTAAGASDRIELPAGVQRLDLHKDAAAIAAESPANLADAAAPEQPVYVIYTSGSTGKPKGVVVPQRALVNFLCSMRREPGLAEGDVLAAVTTLSFDIAGLELYLPWLVGACVELVERHEALDGAALAARLKSSGATVLQATPATWRLLLEAGFRASAGFRGFCGGEAMPRDLADALLDAGVELWNLYGPTETTIWSTASRVGRGTGNVPIGRPIANTQVHVADAQRRLVPVGAVGELFIGGDGVALGYLGREQLTAERFVVDPRAGGSAARWYRTGDLARWRADGTLECLGRSDHQVKVRGYRIELGEIEANLAAHPDVQAAVVVTREDQPGDVRIVAYVVPRSTPVVQDALRDWLRRTLPEYMVPQHVVDLPAIPLLPNGKLDRKSLPAPAAADRSAGGGSGSGPLPATDLERTVVEAMQSVLNIGGLRMTDDFFRLGGHSLLAAKLIARLNRELQTSLPMRTAFERTTPAQLVAAVEAARREGRSAAYPPIQRRPDASHGPLTPGQERIRFMEELHPGRGVYNTPSAHRLRGPMDASAFARAFSQVLERQPALRTVIASDGERHEQQVVDLEYALPLVDLGSLPEPDREPELRRRLQALIARPFDLARGPLFSAALFRLADDHHAFFFMTHHVVWDGWSFDLLYDELAAAYAASLAGRRSGLPPLAVTPIDYAHWYNDWLQSPACAHQIDYWKARFADAEPTKDILTDMPRKPGMSGRGATEWVRVDRALTERLRTIARDAEATLNMAALAAYAAMLHATSRGHELTLGIPVRGRPLPELEPVMGFFNNLLPLRLRVDPSLRFVDWVREVKQHLLGAFDHQDVPFERLVQEVDTLRRSSASGYYQALFSFQDARERIRTWGGLRQESILVFQQGATEDLGLWLMEVPSGLEGGITYNADLFRAETAVLLRERYLRLLQRIAADPAQTLAQLLEVGGDEQRRLDAGAVSSDTTTLVASVLANAARQPEAPAVRAGSATWTYGRLAAQAARVAHTLRVRVPHARRVAVDVADPLLRAAAWLGIWQAGATCVASASHEVDARTGADAVVCDAGIRTPGATAIALAAEADTVVGSSPVATAPALEIASKAAPLTLTHTDVSSLAASIAQTLTLDAGAGFAVHDALPEPARCVEACAAWLAGGAVWLVPDELARDGDQLRAAMAATPPAAAHLPPLAWRGLLDAWWSSKTPLSALVDGVEASGGIAEALSKAGATAWSMHRPARLSVPVALARLEADGTPAHMGAPLVRGMLAIVDDAGKELPVGVPGRLHARVGADGAAHDMCEPGRWRSDGRLLVFQDAYACTPLHGHRIDLAALDARLEADGLAAECVSVVREDRPGDRRLETYVVPASGASFDETIARERLQASLPGGVRVDALHVLATVPRLPDGRPDRAAMLARVGGASAERPAPSTPTELALEAVWRELLGVNRIELGDNFFDLGGSSLLAMQAAEAAAQRIGKRISPRRYVFETLGQLALAYEAEGEALLSPTSAAAQPARKGFLRKLGGLLGR